MPNMSQITIAGPSKVYVTWGCKRCGFQGGVANTTFPVGKDWSEELGRRLFTDLRRHLVKRHQTLHGCIATLDDFIIGEFTPVDKLVVGVIS